MNRIKGIQYPLTKHIAGFLHHASTDVEQVKSDIAAIILTEPGERIFDPYFGTPLNKLNLNAPLELVRSEARQKIALAIKKWEKRVQVTEVIVDLSKTEDKLIIKIQVFFIDPIDIDNIQDLILYKSLGDINGRALPF